MLTFHQLSRQSFPQNCIPFFSTYNECYFSDLVLGENEEDDHMRCCDEVAHIRACLRLATQASRRDRRRVGTETVFKVNHIAERRDSTESDSSVDDKKEYEEDDDPDIETDQVQADGDESNGLKFDS